MPPGTAQSPKYEDHASRLCWSGGRTPPNRHDSRCSRLLPVSRSRRSNHLRRKGQEPPKSAEQLLPEEAAKVLDEQKAKEVYEKDTGSQKIFALKRLFHRIILFSLLLLKVFEYSLDTLLVALKEVHVLITIHELKYFSVYGVSKSLVYLEFPEDFVLKYLKNFLYIQAF